MNSKIAWQGFAALFPDMNVSDEEALALVFDRAAKHLGSERARRGILDGLGLTGVERKRAAAILTRPRGRPARTAKQQERDEGWLAIYDFMHETLGKSRRDVAKYLESLRIGQNWEANERRLGRLLKARREK